MKNDLKGLKPLLLLEYDIKAKSHRVSFRKD